MTDGAGTQVAHYEYTPYGELHSTEGITVPHQYTGKERDPETGFYFYEARYYDPQLGRFLTPDTIVPNWTDPQDFNRYTYAGNNPLKYTDPTGHRKFKDYFKKAAGIIIAVAVTVLTGGFGSPLALAIGGFAGGFGGTLINGGSIGQAFGMGVVGAFAGGVGGVAFQRLGDIARIAAMTAIGATAGASGAAIMGGNIGLGALAGGAAGFIGGAVGGRLADSWDPGLARLGAGIGAAAGAGAAGAAITGGSIGEGAGLGAFAVLAAVAAGQLQQIIDAGQEGGAAERAAVQARAAAAGSSAGAGALRVRGLIREWVGEGPLDVSPGKWVLRQSIPPTALVNRGLTIGGNVWGLYQRTVTATQVGHWEYFGGAIQGETVTRTWTYGEAGFARVHVSYSAARHGYTYTNTEPVRVGTANFWQD